MIQNNPETNLVKFKIKSLTPPCFRYKDLPFLFGCALTSKTVCQPAFFFSLCFMGELSIISTDDFVEVDLWRV